MISMRRYGNSQEEFNENLPVIIERSQVKYSEKGLKDKLSRAARRAGAKVVYAVLLLYYALNSPTIPAKDKGIIYGALGYFILPFDFIHDLLPFAGFTDDFAALAWAVSKVVRNITPEVKQQARKRVAAWFPAVDAGVYEAVEKHK